jgi:peroxiredoxin
MALNIGDEAPDFELPAHTGQPIRLKDFRGKSSVVLAFYVYANTPG